MCNALRCGCHGEAESIQMARVMNMSLYQFATFVKPCHASGMWLPRMPLSCALDANDSSSWPGQAPFLEAERSCTCQARHPHGLTVCFLLSLLAKRCHEPHERSAAARVRGRNATGCAFRDERSSSVNTHTAPARPWGSHGAHPAPVKQPAASGARGPSSHSERADGQVRDARRVLQEGRDEVCTARATSR